MLESDILNKFDRDEAGEQNRWEHNSQQIKAVCCKSRNIKGCAMSSWFMEILHGWQIALLRTLGNKIWSRKHEEKETNGNKQCLEKDQSQTNHCRLQGWGRKAFWRISKISSILVGDLVPSYLYLFVFVYVLHHLWSRLWVGWQPLIRGWPPSSYKPAVGGDLGDLGHPYLLHPSALMALSAYSWRRRKRPWTSLNPQGDKIHFIIWVHTPRSLAWNHLEHSPKCL